MIVNIFILFFLFFSVFASLQLSDYDRQQHIINEYNKRSIRKLFLYIFLKFKNALI